MALCQERKKEKKKKTNQPSSPQPNKKLEVKAKRLLCGGLNMPHRWPNAQLATNRGRLETLFVFYRYSSKIIDLNQGQIGICKKELFSDDWNSLSEDLISSDSIN